MLARKTGDGLHRFGVYLCYSRVSLATSALGGFQFQA